MNALKRSQNLLPHIIGLLLIPSIFVYSALTMSTASWPVWVLGDLIGVTMMVLAMLWLAFPRNRATEALTMLLGAVLFVTPWLLGNVWLSSVALITCLFGAFFIAAGAILFERDWQRGSLFARGGGEVTRSQSYRRVNNSI